MIYLLILFLITISLEVADLFQKKLKKSALKISIITFFITFIDLIYTIMALMPKYSAKIYFIDQYENNRLIFILWIILNLGYAYLLNKILLKLLKHHKQNLKLLKLIYMSLILIAIYLLTIIFHENAAWLILISLIILSGYLIINIIKKHQKLYIIPLVVVVIFTYYSFFTNLGAAKLNVFLNGYPIAAYQTKYEELNYLFEKNITKYSPLNNIPTPNGDMAIIDVKNIHGIKIGHYIGF